jgi:opacity protein-like surface antigen
MLGGTTTVDNTGDDWDIAGVAGAGVGLALADTMILSVEGRYNFGLRDMDGSNDLEVKSRGFQALVGITFMQK